MRTRVKAVLLFSFTLLTCLLRAQNTPDPASYEARAAAYCQALAGGHEQAAALKSACQYALTVQKALPNYICDEKVQRFDTLGSLQDVVDTEVTVIGGSDSYSNLRINGERKDINISQLPGRWSSGEFGALIPLLFAPENKAEFRFKKRVRLESRSALLFSFKVLESENKSFFLWYEDGKQFKPGYSGSVWLDKETGHTIHLKMTSTRWEDRYLEVNAEYGEVPLKDGLKFLLPRRSSVNSCTEISTVSFMPGVSGDSSLRLTNVRCARNELEFMNCRKFRAETKITGVE